MQNTNKSKVVNTTIKKISKARKHTKNSLIKNFIESQLASKQIGINIVVNTKKNKEIPSRANARLIFKNGTQSKYVQNWKAPSPLSKNSQSRKDSIKVRIDVNRATFLPRLILKELLKGIASRANVPREGIRIW